MVNPLGIRNATGQLIPLDVWNPSDASLPNRLRYAGQFDD